MVTRRQGKRAFASALTIVVTCILLAQVSFSPSAVASSVTPQFNGSKAYTHLQTQMAFGNRIPESSSHANCVNYIASTMRNLGLKVTYQNFTGASGDGQGVAFVNIIGVLEANSTTDQRVLLGAHYDTRPFSDHDIAMTTIPPDYAHPVPGANDGASGVAVLLELARVMARYNRTRDIYFLFFDGEDYGKDLNSMLYGSRYYASKMTSNEVTLSDYFVLFDMVGDADLAIYRELNSDIALQDRIFAKAESLGVSQFKNATRYTIIDDHIPFKDRGIRSVDIIDFDYLSDKQNYWHTPNDTLDKVSAVSLEAVGKVAEGFLVDHMVVLPQNGNNNNTTPPPDPPKPKPKPFIPAFEGLALVAAVAMAIVIGGRKLKR